MLRRLLLLLFLVSTPMVLTSCQALGTLLKAPLGILTRLLSVGGRVVGMEENLDRPKPLRLEPGEIERARKAQGLPGLESAPPEAGVEAVAQR